MRLRCINVCVESSLTIARSAQKIARSQPRETLHIVFKFYKSLEECMPSA
jgi:hypothetical protein